MELWGLLSALWPIIGLGGDSGIHATLERNPTRLRKVRKVSSFLFVTGWLFIIGYFVLRFVTSDITNILLSDHPESIFYRYDVMIAFWPVIWYAGFLVLRANKNPSPAMRYTLLTTIIIWCLFSLFTELSMIFMVSFARSPL